MSYKQLLAVLGIIALSVGSAWFGVKLFTQPQPQSFGAANVEPHTFQDELCFVSSSCVGWQTIQMPAGKNYVTWTNNSGATTTVLDSIAKIDSGVASSSYRVYLFATSTVTPVASQLMVAPVPKGGASGGGSWATSSMLSITGVLWATTTSATTTNLALPALQVPPGWTVMGMIINADTQSNFSCRSIQDATTTSSVTAPITCEQATSTNRGFNPIFQFTTRR